MTADQGARGLAMEKNQPIVTSMRMKTFDEDSVKKELVVGEERAEEASNIRDSPDRSVIV